MGSLGCEKKKQEIWTWTLKIQTFCECENILIQKHGLMQGQYTHSLIPVSPRPEDVFQSHVEQGKLEMERDRMIIFWKNKIKHNSNMNKAKSWSLDCLSRHLFLCNATVSFRCGDELKRMSDDVDENKPLPLLQQPGNKRTTPLVIYLNVTINNKHNQTLLTPFSSLIALKLLPRSKLVHILPLRFLALF